jgi:hypothetical protein
MKQKTTETAEVRQGWREDGRVDIDAVRAGTPDLADAAGILESLCDEVEALRAQAAPVEDEKTKLVRYLREFADEVEAGRVPVDPKPNASLYYFVRSDDFGGHDGAMAEVERIASELGATVSHRPHAGKVQHTAYRAWGDQYATRVEYPATYFEQVEGGEL